MTRIAPPEVSTKDPRYLAIPPRSGGYSRVMSMIGVMFMNLHGSLEPAQDAF